MSLVILHKAVTQVHCRAHSAAENIDTFTNFQLKLLKISFLSWQI